MKRLRGALHRCTGGLGPKAQLLLLLGIVSVPGWTQDEAALETEAKHLETLLIAPCCWRQPISEHQSGDAVRMKSEVRAMLSEGKSEQEILDHYLETYGARILSIPPQEGFNRMSFLMPVFFTLAGFVIVGVVLRRWRHQAVSATPSDAAKAKQAPEELAVDNKMSSRIQKELDAMDEY